MLAAVEWRRMMKELDINNRLVGCSQFVIMFATLCRHCVDHIGLYTGGYGNGKRCGL